VVFLFLAFFKERKREMVCLADSIISNTSFFMATMDIFDQDIVVQIKIVRKIFVYMERKIKKLSG